MDRRGASVFKRYGDKKWWNFKAKLWWKSYTGCSSNVVRIWLISKPMRRGPYLERWTGMNNEKLMKIAGWNMMHAWQAANVYPWFDTSIAIPGDLEIYRMTSPCQCHGHTWRWFHIHLHHTTMSIHTSPLYPHQKSPWPWLHTIEIGPICDISTISDIILSDLIMLYPQALPQKNYIDHCEVLEKSPCQPMCFTVFPKYPRCFP